MRTLKNTRLALKWAALAAVLGLGIAAGGCRNLLDQSDLSGRPAWGKSRLEKTVLSSIDPLDEGTVEYVNAQDVSPDDLKAYPVDYVISKNDFLQISVTDLNGGGGVETVRQNRVSETGMLTLPLLSDPIMASGLTEQQLQKAIADKYRDADVLKNAQVNVVVVEARGKTFYAKGAVGRPGQFAIVDSDFRLLNALVQCGDVPVSAAEYDYLYIIRKKRSEQPAGASTLPKNNTETNKVDENPANEPVKPQTDPLKPESDPLAPPPGAAGEPAIRPFLAAAEGEGEAGGTGTYIIIDGKPVLIGAGEGAKPAAEAPNVAREPVTPEVAQAPQAEPTSQPHFEFGQTLEASDDVRVIRVPLKLLNAGDLRYNVVIRPDDIIIVPTPNIGLYYMGGHVGSPGAFSLSGTKLTLKQAIIAARMLDPLAVPQKTDVIRRFEGNKEVYVRVDLDDIFTGKAPDLFIKPNDTIIVGTDWYPPFLQAIRTSFRFSTGFGFLYDRNYAPQQKQQTN